MLGGSRAYSHVVEKPAICAESRTTEGRLAYLTVKLEARQRYTCHAWGAPVFVQCGWLLTIANLGDSRAVLDTGAQILQLSVDHRVATHRGERHRLERTGALIAPIDVSGAAAARRAAAWCLWSRRWQRLRARWSRPSPRASVPWRPPCSRGANASRLPPAALRTATFPCRQRRSARSCLL